MPYQPGNRLRDFLRRLPKTETHLHIEGALPWDLLHGADPQRFSSPPASWGEPYKFSGFEVFERELLEMAFAWFNSPERYHEAARLVFDRLRKEQNVHYIETSFASGLVEYLDLDGAAVAEAIKSAAPTGLPVTVFMGIHHDGYTPRSRSFIDECLHWTHLDGLDLHGTETVPLEAWTAGIWKRACDHGKLTKAHAGEFGGPEFIWKVVDELGVKRIQHGVRAVESPRLVRHLVEIGAVLDVCPISNVKLGVVESMAQHPIRELYDAGVIYTLNSRNRRSMIISR